MRVAGEGSLQGRSPPIHRLIRCPPSSSRHHYHNDYCFHYTECDTYKRQIIFHEIEITVHVTVDIIFYAHDFDVAIATLCA